jgi:hypothetical protein
MVSIIAARSRTHFASSAVASRATAISASTSNFFIMEKPPTCPQLDAELSKMAARLKQSNCPRGICFRGNPG